MAGRYNFNIPGRPDASIVNMGTITATNGGFAALVAPGVRNSGTITANLGTVVLGAGNYLTLDFYGDKLITLGVGDEIAGQVKDVATGETLKSLVTNTGKLSANGGRVELTAAAARHVVDSVINTSGVIEANSVGVKNGQIVLSAATAGTKGGYDGGAGLPKQTVRVSGKLSASGKQPGTKGGKIVVTGENIEVAGATIDASGRDGGGKVLIGGDWGGGNPDKSLGEQPERRDGRSGAADRHHGERRCRDHASTPRRSIAATAARWCCGRITPRRSPERFSRSAASSSAMAASSRPRARAS